MRAPQRLNARLGQAEVLDLSLRYEVANSARDVLDRHIRIDAVLVEKVDGLDAEAPKRTFDGLPDVLRAAVHPAAVLAGRGIDVETELGGDHDLVAERAYCLPDDQLIFERPIDLGCVEEGDPPFEGGADQRDAVVLRELVG